MRHASIGRRVVGTANRMLMATLHGSFVWVAALFLCAAAPALAGGGNVQPPEAKPSGYPLAKMAAELAYFNSSGNDPKYYPDTPFQILFASGTDYSLVDQTILATGSNTFHVKTETRFFVPVFGFDDSPPVVGDYPARSQDAADYIFGPDEVGGHDVFVKVDGKVTEIGPDYVAGPVTVPNLLDGGGSQEIQVGAFLTPLTKGTHTVTVGAIFDGAAFLDAYGVAFDIEYTYTVIVE
jgi:hypothetical protein